MAGVDGDEANWMDNMDDRVPSLPTGGLGDTYALSGDANNGDGRRRESSHAMPQGAKGVQQPWMRPGQDGVPLDVHDPKYFPRPAKPGERSTDKVRWDTGRSQVDDRRGAGRAGVSGVIPGAGVGHGQRWIDPDTRTPPRPSGVWGNAAAESRPPAAERPKDGMWCFQKGVGNNEDWRAKSNRRENPTQDTPGMNTVSGAPGQRQTSLPGRGRAFLARDGHGAGVGSRAADSLATQEVGVWPGGAATSARSNRIRYTKAQMESILRIMHFQADTELSLPDDANTALEVSEVWRSLRAPPDPGHGVPSPPAVRPPPGMLSPRQRQRLKEVMEQLGNHSRVPCPLQVLKEDKYQYLDSANRWQGSYDRANIEVWARAGYFPPTHTFRAPCSGDVTFEFQSVEALWELQDRLHLSPEELAELTGMQERRIEPSAPPAVSTAALWPATTAEGTLQPQEARLQHTPSWTPGSVQDLASGPPARSEGLPLVPDHSAPGSLGAMAAAASHPAGPGKPRAYQDPIDAIIDYPRTEATQPRVLAEQPLQAPLRAESGGAQTASLARTPVYPSPAPAQQAPAVTQPSAPSPHNAAPVWQRGSAPTIAIAPQSGGGGARLPGSAAPRQDNNMLNQLFAVPSTQAPGREFKQMHVSASVSKQPPAPPPPLAPEAERGMQSQDRDALQTLATWAPKDTAAQGAPLASIQAEQAREAHRAMEQAAVARNEMATREQARRNAWLAQPQQVSLRQVMDEDEECAADLEGGRYEGQDECDLVLPARGAAWQEAAQPAVPPLSGSTRQQGTGNSGPQGSRAVQTFWDGIAAIAPTMAQPLDPGGPARNGVHRTAQLQPPPPPPPPRTGWDRAPGANTAAEAPLAAPRGAPVVQPAQPKLAVAALRADEEPEIFRADPHFRQWCLDKMGEFGGNMTVLMLLLETGANFEVAEIAQAYLQKRDGISTFVAEFISRRARAGKPASGKRSKKKAAAVSVPAGQSQARAAPAVHERASDGWAMAGSGSKAKGKGKKSSVVRAQGGTRNGNPYAALDEKS